MRIATKDETTGLTLAKRRSTRHPTKTITDTDFADDIALLSNLIEEGKLLLLRVESAAAQVGLHVNQKKTEYIVTNQPEGNLIALTNWWYLKRSRGFPISGILDRKHRKRYGNKNRKIMGGIEQNEHYMEIKSKQEYQDWILSSNSRECPPIWSRNMDPYKKAGKKIRWSIHKIT